MPRFFLDWLTSQEVQEYMNNTQYRRTIRKDVPSGDVMVSMEDIHVMKMMKQILQSTKQKWLEQLKIFSQN